MMDRKPNGVEIIDSDAEPELRRCAAEKVANHELPWPERLGGVGRAGSGEKCALCGLAIEKYRNEKYVFEYEVEWTHEGRAETLRFHSDCFRAWASLAAGADESRGV